MRFPALALLLLAVSAARSGAQARVAQRRFEEERRAWLPVRGGRDGECDARIGRFCYWADTVPDPAVPESPRVARARERLLGELAQALRAKPGDEWLSGQRVRYLIDGGWLDSAVAAARECRGGWTCAALEGLALHSAQRWGGGDSAFARALAQMSEKQRCAWNDIEPLLDGALRARWKASDCATRARIAAYAWWRATPAMGHDGNDLRTEYFARRTLMLLWDGTATPHGVQFGADLRELMVRYGVPAWYSRTIAGPGALSEPPVIGHDHAPSYAWLPVDSAPERLVTGARDDVHARGVGARARYAPPYARQFREMDAQLSAFRRGDSMRVVAAYALADTIAGSAAVRGVLALSPSPEMVRRTHVASARWSGVMSMTSPAAAQLVSVELSREDSAGFARVREVVAPNWLAPGRLGVSSMLLFAAREGAEVRTLDDAVAAALPSARLVRVTKVGLFWETYGVSAGGEELAVALTVEPIEVGALRKVKERLHLARVAPTLSIRWTDRPVRAGGEVPRAVSVDLGSLPSGRYRLKLVVSSGNGAAAEAFRDVEIVR
ncbi:MAG: hypothetical protein JWO05_863 [Gemmatimonadetes bacterium]|nr:hypothetical protein [Gemmatimonadota bacterium]